MALNQVIGGDYVGSRVTPCTINSKDYKVISIRPEKYGINEISLPKGSDSVKSYEVVNQESSRNMGNAVAGAALFGIVGAIIGSGSSTAYTIAIEYYYGSDLKRSLIEVDSNLHSMFIASMF